MRTLTEKILAGMYALYSALTDVHLQVSAPCRAHQTKKPRLKNRGLSSSDTNTQVLLFLCLYTYQWKLIGVHELPIYKAAISSEWRSRGKCTTTGMRWVNRTIVICNVIRT